MNGPAMLAERFGGGGTIVTAHAPGRVNLIGEHTDYNEGFVMPTILGCRVEVSVRCRPDQSLHMFAADLGETVEYRLGEGPSSDQPGWSLYLVGLAEELHARGLVSGGVDLTVRGTIPRGSGLSSSAALETSAALALERAFDFALDPLEMARLCRDVEHRWVGVRCGIMDQMVSRLGRPGHALFIDCLNLSHRHVPLDPGDHALVITDSGVRRQLTDSPYNQRRKECEEGVSLLRRRDPDITSLRDVDPDFLDAHSDVLPDTIARRCRHVVKENNRVLAAETALVASDLPTFGKLMTESHESLRTLFEASQPTIDRLVASALEVPGVLGSRLTGAGWGGCTVSLCTQAAVEPLRRHLESMFTELDLEGSVIPVGPTEAAGIVEATA